MSEAESRRVFTLTIDRDDKGWDHLRAEMPLGERRIVNQHVFHSGCPVGDLANRIEKLVVELHHEWHNQALFGEEEE